MSFTSPANKQREFQRARAENRKPDLLHHVRPLLDAVNSAALKFFIPGRDLCIDEGGAANNKNMPREVCASPCVVPLGAAYATADYTTACHPQLYHDRRHKPIPTGFNIIIVCDNATRLPLRFYIVDKRDKFTATQMVEHLMAELPPNHYHVYTDRVRSQARRTQVLA